MVCIPNINDVGRTNDLNHSSPLMNHLNESEKVLEHSNQELNEDDTTLLCVHHYHPFSTNLYPIKSTEQHIKRDGGTYIIDLEIPQIKLHEIMVQITTNRIVIVEGLKKNGMNDKNDIQSKHFRKYFTLPLDCDNNSIKFYLLPTGILRITAKQMQEPSNILENMMSKINL